MVSPVSLLVLMYELTSMFCAISAGLLPCQEQVCPVSFLINTALPSTFSFC